MEARAQKLGKREPPPSLPKYGYLIERAGVPVGALLIICATLRTGSETLTRCNFSSWYVEPEFRLQATLLVSMALRRKDVTYINVSPAQHTLAIIGTQGFSRYCDGVFMAVPLFSPRMRSERGRVRIFDAHEHADISFDFWREEIILTTHRLAASVYGAKHPIAPIPSCFVAAYWKVLFRVCN